MLWFIRYIARHMHGLGGYAQITDMDTHGYEYGSESGYPCIHVSVSGFKEYLETHAS
jgi:hypothetical protein